MNIRARLDNLTSCILIIIGIVLQGYRPGKIGNDYDAYAEIYNNFDINSGLLEPIPRLIFYSFNKFGAEFQSVSIFFAILSGYMLWKVASRICLYNKCSTALLILLYSINFFLLYNLAQFRLLLSALVFLQALFSKSAYSRLFLSTLSVLIHYTMIPIVLGSYLRIKKITIAIVFICTCFFLLTIDVDYSLLGRYESYFNDSVDALNKSMIGPLSRLGMYFFLYVAFTVSIKKIYQEFECKLYQGLTILNFAILVFWQLNMITVCVRFSELGILLCFFGICSVYYRFRNSRLSFVLSIGALTLYMTSVYLFSNTQYLFQQQN